MRTEVNVSGKQAYESTEGVPEAFRETPESKGAMAALAAKANAQGCIHFFDDPIHVRRDLIRLGCAAGWDTPKGHTISNIIQIIENLADYERPDWATDERQTLQYSANQQIKRLARLSAGRPA
ncbi:hypothetical protein JQ600_35370 [Bradyrhizobium sp. AUGA SZCCT0176]|uniref:hypothetical protein n=1 Tax=Bradyrhizobium sp. AUGA SZCCT0176 TaxID=2807664 RepID=UPI001BA8DB9B|nr:hypothetical protein [Bradyrhizobium sp. AUGA SZCCT0176]MBR1230177.1 hypothetical protein [Bradyrhizobium sp. AUGA SZCCT0176]